MEESQTEHIRILLTETQVIEMLQYMKQKVKVGDYIVLWNLEKNKKLKEDYYISNDMVRAILLALDAKEDYRWAEKSINDNHENDIVNVYKINVSLKKKNDGNDYDVTIYIKFAHDLVDDTKKSVVIGFHEDNVIL